jgi:hypothetical protein
VRSKRPPWKDMEFPYRLSIIAILVNTEYKLKNALKNNPFNLCGSENRSIH